jgi:hypothetical protein
LTGAARLVNQRTQLPRLSILLLFYILLGPDHMGKIYSSQKKRIKETALRVRDEGDSFREYGSNRRLPRLW